MNPKDKHCYSVIELGLKQKQSKIFQHTQNSVNYSIFQIKVLSAIFVCQCMDINKERLGGTNKNINRGNNIWQMVNTSEVVISLFVWPFRLPRHVVLADVRQHGLTTINTGWESWQVLRIECGFVWYVCVCILLLVRFGIRIRITPKSANLLSLHNLEQSHNRIR